MERDQLNLGKKLQMYRTTKGFSLRELSDLTGITSSMLSQIEHEQVNPSINTLKTIAQALSVPLYRFFQEEEASGPVVSPDKRKTIGRPDEGDVFYELLTPDTSGTIEFCMMIIPPNSDTSELSHCHTGEEVAYFLEGDTVDLVIEDVTYTLFLNDSVRIKSFSRHTWKNNTDQPVKIIFAITPPSF